MLKDAILIYFGLILYSSGLDNKKPDFNIFIHFHETQDAKDNVSKDESGMDYNFITQNKGNLLSTLCYCNFLYIFLFSIFSIFTLA